MAAETTRASEIVERAEALSEAIRTTTRAHAFSRDVDAFAQLLREVPDWPRFAFSADAIALFRSLAELVIARIEARLNSDRPERLQVQLAAGVYDIRRSLEEIDRWCRHFGERS
jgi:hypothetical protein